MATIKCNEPKYTILTSGGKPIANNVSAVDAAAALTSAVEDDACPEPPEPLQGLRLTYTEGDLPAFDLATWNTFFDLPANGTAFTSIVTAGDEVTLIGGSGITFKASLFRTSDKILKIEDDVDCVVAVAGGKVAGAVSLCPNLTTVTLNGVTTAGQEAFKDCTSLTTYTMWALQTAGQDAFKDCTSLTTYTMPALQTAGSSCFYGCTSVTTFAMPALQTMGDNCFRLCTSLTTVTMPLLNALGTTTGFDSVFDSCTALTSVTVPTALATVDAGNPDGDLVYADGTLGATITYV